MSFRPGASQFFERRGAPTTPLPYDAEVAWLESAGGQYLDSGVNSRDGLIFNARVYSDSFGGSGNVWIVRARMSASNKMFGCYIGRSNLKLGGGLNGILSATISAFQKFTFSMSAWHDIVLCTTSGGKYVEFDGIKSTIFDNSDTEVGESILLLTNLKTSGYSSGLRIASCAIKDSATGSPLRDLIPVRVGMEGAMYDRVSGQLFRNQGTGAFTIGPDKS